MKTILQCITLSEAGGAQQIVKSLCEGFSRDNRVILATAPDGELYNWAKESGIMVYPLKNMVRGISPIKDVETLIQLIKIIKKEKPDVVHCHSWKAGVLGRIAAFLCAVKKIFFTVHGWSILSYSNKLTQAIYIFIEKILGIITTRLICVCEKDTELGIRLKIAAPGKFCTVYNGINDINLKEEKIREIYNIPSDAIVCGTVARLAEQKRCIETVEIISELIKERPDLYYLYIGDGPLFEEMELKIKELGIEGRFILTGSQNNVPDYLKAMDIFVLLSNYEGLPVSILEAMSAGLPIIASDVGGVSELVHEKENGYLVSNHNEEIKEKINNLMNNSESRDFLGNNSKLFFKENFTVDKMFQGYDKLYS